MLGGYYLGQLYLGESGLPAAGVLAIQNTSHDHTVDSIILLQQHVIVVSNTTHSLTSDNLDLIEHKTLVLNDASHVLTSDVIDLIQQHTVVVSDSLHGLTSDSIILLQKHTLAVADSQHSHTVDGNLVLDQYLLLNQPDPGVFSVTSPEIWIAQNNILAVDNTMHTLVGTLSRIINWADYNYSSGIYIKDFSQSGDLQEFGSLDAGTLISQNKNTGLFEPAQIDSGVFVKSTDKQGQLN